MKKILQLIALLFIFIIFPAIAHCELIWEKEFTTVNFVEPKVHLRLFECNNSFFIYFSGIDKESVKIVNGKITGDRYPVIMKIGENGDAVYQNEKRLPLIDSLKNSGITPEYEVRACNCRNNELLFDIPQKFALVDKTPNLYSFSTTDGSLKNIKGTTSDAFSYIIQRYQPRQTWEAIISDTEEIVLTGHLEDDNQSGIDFHNLIGDENGLTLKYRILLDMDDFRDSVFEGNYAQNFLQVDDNSFIVKYAAKSKSDKVIFAKYSYDKEAAAMLPLRDTMSSNLDWYTIYKPEIKSGGGSFAKFTLMDNGNLFVLNAKGCISVLNPEGEVIFNKVIFSEDKYQNYTIQNFTPLKSKPGYYAFWGYYKSNSNFAILITDNEWNVVDSIVWNYENTLNNIDDIKEKQNGNLMVLGKHFHKEPSPGAWVTYYAEVRPNYTSVNDHAVNGQIEVSPNPAGDFITISLKPSEGFEPSEGSTIQIYNTLGEKVMMVEQTSSSVQHIIISSLPKGMYFVKVGGETAKFVKK